jgi:hypothetical protein
LILDTLEIEVSLFLRRLLTTSLRSHSDITVHQAEWRIRTPKSTDETLTRARVCFQDRLPPVNPQEITRISLSDSCEQSKEGASIEAVV